ncbi:hypothetical protein AB0P32_10070 [Streptomyces sp. NPDC085995]|uniref:hypothetical protein n=1 Tax=Streptomyces sp. NPDC085995 TaxID=3154861 RepID=UPI00343F6F04
MAREFAHGGESATADTCVAEIAPATAAACGEAIVFVAISSGSAKGLPGGGPLAEVHLEPRPRR